MIVRNAFANAVGMAIAIAVQAGLSFGSYRIVGAEQFGLIGLYSTLMVAASIFDIGLGQSVTRETARRRAEAGGVELIRGMTANFLGLYGLLAVAIIAVATLGAPFVAEHWLKSATLSIADIAHSIELAGVAIAIQRIRGVFQATLDGLERQVVTNSLMSITNIVRLLLALASMLLIEPTAKAFFWSQILASVIETGTFFLVTWRMLPKSTLQLRFDPALIKEAGRFAAVNAAAAALGTFIQIADSLIISAVVPLATFGTYSLISSMCTMMLRMATPVLSAAYPRMSTLVRHEHRDQLMGVFLSATEVTTSIIWTACATLVFFGPSLLELVTKHAEIGQQFGPVLAILAVAYALNGTSRGPHALQMAEGRPKISLYINILIGAVYLPAILLFTSKFGIMFPASCLLAVNAVAFGIFAYTALAKYPSGQLFAWLTRSLSPQIAAILGLQALVAVLTPGTASLWLRLGVMLITAVLVFSISLLVGPNIRRALFAFRKRGTV